MMVEELDLIESFRDLNLVVKLRPNSMCLGMLKISSGFLRNKGSLGKRSIFVRKVDSECRRKGISVSKGFKWNHQV